MDVQAKIITQFIRDLSFENPQGPMSFRAQTEKPEIKANIDVKATNQKDTNVFEIELNINVAAIQNEKNVYLIDLKYVGIFEIETTVLFVFIVAKIATISKNNENMPSPTWMDWGLCK